MFSLWLNKNAPLAFSKKNLSNHYNSYVRKFNKNTFFRRKTFLNFSIVSFPSPAYFWNSLLTHIIHFLSSLKKFYIIPITINNLNNIITKNNHLITNHRPINSMPTPNHVPFEIIEGIRVMGLNTTFNTISVISWWSVLLVDET